MKKSGILQNKLTVHDIDQSELEVLCRKASFSFVTLTRGLALHRRTPACSSASCTHSAFRTGWVVHGDSRENVGLAGDELGK